VGKQKDLVKRKRRKMTPQELERARTNREAAKRQNAQRAYGTVATHFRQSNEARNDDAPANNTEENALHEYNGSIAQQESGSEETLVPDDVVIFSEDADAGFDDDPAIIANLDIDDDVGDDLDEGAEAEAANVEPEKLKRGVQNDYMRAIQERPKSDTRHLLASLGRCVSCHAATICTNPPRG
jgi:hypothetical protein